MHTCACAVKATRWGAACAATLHTEQSSRHAGVVPSFHRSEQHKLRVGAGPGQPLPHSSTQHPSGARRARPQAPPLQSALTGWQPTGRSPGPARTGPPSTSRSRGQRGWHRTRPRQRRWSRTCGAWCASEGAGFASATSLTKRAIVTATTTLYPVAHASHPRSPLCRETSALLDGCVSQHATFRRGPDVFQECVEMNGSGLAASLR